MASYTDMAQLNNHINDVITNDNQLVTEAKYQLSVIRTAATDLIDQETQINNLATLTDNLTYVVQHLHDQDEEVGYAQLNFYQHLIASLNVARTYIHNLQSIIAVLKQNRLPINFINHEQLQQLLIEIETQLPDNQKLAIPFNQRINSYYEVPLVTHIPCNHTLRILFKIPLTTPTQLYHIYEAIPFPTTLPANDTTTTRLQWIGPPTHLALSPAKTSFARLPYSFDLNQCLQTNPYICPANQPFTTNVNQDCLYQLLTGRTDSKPIKACTYQTLSHNGAVTKQLDHTKWLFSTTHQERAKITCINREQPTDVPSAKPDLLLPPGEHILQLPDQCQAQIADLWIPFRLRLHNTALHAKTLLHTPTFNENDWHKISQSSTNISSLLTNGHAQLLALMAHSNSSITEYRDFLRTVQPHAGLHLINPTKQYTIDPASDYLSHLIYAAFALSTLLVVGLITTTVCKLVLRRRKHRQPTPLVRYDVSPHALRLVPQAPQHPPPSAPRTPHPAIRSYITTDPRSPTTGRHPIRPEDSSDTYQ
jgi:hypothetical protein